MTLSRSLLVFAAFLACFSLGRADEEHHGNESLWEWAGEFHLEAGEVYTWTAEKGGADHDDEYGHGETEMQILIMSEDTDREVAEEAWEDENIAEIESGGTIPVGTAVHLHFNQESWISTYSFTIDVSGHYVIFAQHIPTEFENSLHYLKDDHGHDVEPENEEFDDHEHDDDDHDEAEDDHHHDDWGLVIGGSLLTALPSLVLIAVVGPLLLKIPKSFLDGVSCFASGAIFAAAAFLMLPEGYLLAAAGQDETTASWTWGTAILGGWFLGVLIHYFSGSAGEHSHEDEKADGNEMQPINFQENTMSTIDWSVATPVLFGDMWHNLVDGMAIGFAAKACDSSLVWSIVGATAGHEIPQEFGDFVVLLTKAHMPWYLALVLNFASALASVVGAVIAYKSDVSSNFEGIGLAFGAGIYLFIALTELGPQVLGHGVGDWKFSSLNLLLFVMGAVCIGLVLLDHEHCYEEGGTEAGGSHDGHGHR